MMKVGIGESQILEGMDNSGESRQIHKNRFIYVSIVIYYIF